MLNLVERINAFLYLRQMKRFFCFGVYQWSVVDTCPSDIKRGENNATREAPRERVFLIRRCRTHCQMLCGSQQKTKKREKESSARREMVSTSGDRAWW